MPTVVLLRSSSDLPDQYTHVLESAGFTVLPVPTLKFSFCLDQLDGCLKDGQRYSALVLTSPRAAEAVLQSCSTASLLSDVWADKPVYVVGEATAGLVRSQLNPSRLLGEDTGSSSALAELILTQTWSKPLLFPRGSMARDELPRRLLEAHVPLESVTVYRTECHPQLVDTLRAVLLRRPEFLVFFSPSAVRFSKDTLALCGGDARIVAIGATTAEAVRAEGLEVFAIAAKPSPVELCKALRQEGTY